MIGASYRTVNRMVCQSAFVEYSGFVYQASRSCGKMDGMMLQHDASCGVAVTSEVSHVYDRKNVSNHGRRW